MKLRALAAVLVTAGSTCLAASALAAETIYTIDPGHTQVDFRWNHLGLSNPAASFDQVAGTLRWDDAEPTKSSVEVTMPLQGIRSRDAMLDQHFHGPDFFDSKRFPNVSFRSTKVERAGIGNRYRVTGDLTVRDVTRPVVLDVSLNGKGEHPMFKGPALGFDATGRILRSEFGLGYGVPMVSDEVRIRITSEAIEAAAFKRGMEEMAKAANK